LAVVANARVCAGLLFALVVFLFVAGGTLQELGLAEACSRRQSLVGLTGNLGLYGLFFWLTLHLAKNGGHVVAPWAATALWALLALGIGATALLVFVPLRVPVLRVGRLWMAGAAALGLGLAFALLIPWAQSYWPRWHGPALALDRALLQWTYGEGLTGMSREGFPVIGNRF